MGRFPAAALALAFAVAVLAPSAAAEEMTADLTFANDFTSMTITATVTMDGATSADMREAFDANGNSDGQATQAEADQFLEDFGEMIEQGAKEGMDPGDMKLDGNPGTSVQITKLAAHDAAGPVASTSPIRLEMGLRATLKPGAGPTHTLVMSGDSEPDESSNITGQLRVRAPSGYIIKSHNAGASGSLSADKRVLTVVPESSPNDSEEAMIVFAPGGGLSSPGVGAFATATVLAAAVIVRRRD